jgi:hypothetical protein
MKKIFTLVSVLLVIAFGAGQAIGAVGTMDDVLAPNIFAPFFLVDTDLTNPQENTLIVYQEMTGRGAIHVPDLTPTTIFHGFVYDINSNLIFDWWPDPLTPYDVNQFYMSSVMELMPVASRALLQVTVDGTAYYAGYMVMENQDFAAANHVGGWVYQVSLAAGKASCSKLPAREWAMGAQELNQGIVFTPGTALAQRQIRDWTNYSRAWYYNLGLAVNGVDGPGAAAAINTNVVSSTVQLALTNANVRSWFSELESFSPNAYAIAMERSFGIVLNAPSAAVATWSLFPRYFIMDSNAATYFFIWTNVRTASLINHVDIYDENENAMSIRVPLPSELNIINAADYIPPSFISGQGDYGFFHFNWGTALNAINSTIRNQDWVVYSYQMATGAANESWNVLERGYAAVGT